MPSVVPDDVPLGKTSEYPTTYTPSLLRSIERATMRAALGVKGRLAVLRAGHVELLRVLVAECERPAGNAHRKGRVPCNSAAIVESKSMKLYLNSFAQTVFATPRRVADDVEFGSGVGVSGRR